MKQLFFPLTKTFQWLPLISLCLSWTIVQSWLSTSSSSSGFRWWLISVQWDSWDKIHISFLRWRSSPWWTWWCCWTALPTSPSSGWCSWPSQWGSGMTPTFASSSNSTEPLLPPSTGELIWYIMIFRRWSNDVSIHLQSNSSGGGDIPGVDGLPCRILLQARGEGHQGQALQVWQLYYMLC